MVLSALQSPGSLVAQQEPLACSTDRQRDWLQLSKDAWGFLQFNVGGISFLTEASFFHAADVALTCFGIR